MIIHDIFKSVHSAVGGLVGCPSVGVSSLFLTYKLSR